MFLYRNFPGKKHLNRFIGNLLSEPDRYWTEYLADAFLCYNLNFTIPKLATDREFQNLKAPVILITAEKDYSFPGKPAEERGKKIFTTLKYSEVIEGAKHSPPTDDGFRLKLAATLAENMF